MSSPKKSQNKPSGKTKTQRKNEQRQRQRQGKTNPNMTGAIATLQQQLKAAKADIDDSKTLTTALVKAIEDPKNSPFIGSDGKFVDPVQTRKQMFHESIMHVKNFNHRAILQTRPWFLDEIRATNVYQGKLIPKVDEKAFAAPSADDQEIKYLKQNINDRAVNKLKIDEQVIRLAELMGKQKETVKEKSEPAPATHPVLKSILHNRMGGKGGRLQNVRTTLAFVGSQSSSANTALQFVQGVDPSTSTEFASFASLFDEVKVHGGNMKIDVASTGGAPTFTDVAMSYDPVDLSVYTNVSAVLVASHHMGPMKLEAATTVGTTINGPGPVDRTGYWTFKFKCPNGPQVDQTNSAAANQVVTGMWATCAQTPMYFGFLKGYVPGAGSSVVVTIYYYLLLDVEFRSRT